jgi:hypothetical protein
MEDLDDEDSEEDVDERENSGKEYFIDNQEDFDEH